MLKLPKSTTVKNKSAANRQVTTQILRFLPPPSQPYVAARIRWLVVAHKQAVAAAVTERLSVAVAQITAEQILRESRDLQEKDFKAPAQLITNEAEQGEYRLRKRKEFEDTVRRVRWNLSVWQKVCHPWLWHGRDCC